MKKTELFRVYRGLYYTGDYIAHLMGIIINHHKDHYETILGCDLMQSLRMFLCFRPVSISEDTGKEIPKVESIPKNHENKTNKQIQVNGVIIQIAEVQ